MSAQKKFAWGFRILGLVHFVLGAGILFSAPIFQTALNLVPSQFGWFEPLPEGAAPLWQSLAALLVFNQGVLCFIVGQRPNDKVLTAYLLFCKVFAALGFIYVFQTSHQYFAYIAAAIGDLLVAIWITWRMARLAWSQPDSISPTTPV